MTTTRVIILAQGEQRRLPDLKIPKQLLGLPACDNATILFRTLCQVARILHDDPKCSWRRPMIVCGSEICQHFERMGGILRPDMVTLEDPGNSSLKGIARYLDACAGLSATTWASTLNADPWDTTVVLLGDVVYSWACLRELLKPMRKTMAEYLFAGSHDLTSSGGELWGVAWNEVADDMMRTRLAHALAKHPPFTSYQPGQMRRWLWEFCISPHVGDPSRVRSAHWHDGAQLVVRDLGSLTRTGRYVAIDDYTRDIDVPEHLIQIPWLSEMAAADDKANGVTW